MDKILVSACLMGAKVRYDGRDNLLEHPALQRWKAQGRLLMVCPESLGGLPTPRPPAETQSRFPILVTTREGDDVTPEFLAGAEATLKLAKQHSVCCALMKSRSPSCGNTQIYDGSFSGTLTEAPGVAADELIRNGIPVFNEHQLEELIRFVEAQTEAA
ncbi:MAG: DUF523 domain-containing protein [Nitrincola lacisaponensis]|uniref:Purine nucleoside phosphorylase n=1 Tax=Nitrincola lacisaponensis TaxID=267850 RepID=A0A063XYQ8_9GAMM|nr:DUF523 domain-containing protein [Nitrincola lacisaponensis]KDE38634.1 Purine nucleoside phosphorylase [Nitrincola lacisaponensis]